MTPAREARSVLALGVLAGPLGAGALSLASGRAALPVPAVAASLQVALLMLLVAPVLEELAFRGTLQDVFKVALGRLGIADAGRISRSNMLTSLAFAACHLSFQTAPMACAILVPSLALGRVRELTGSVVPCIVLHAWFNACFIAAFAR